MTQHRIVFQPSGRQGPIAEGSSILDAAREMGIGIEAICGGRQTCAKCRVSVAEGQFAKYGLTSSATHVTEVQPAESACRDEHVIRVDERLACAAHIYGDVVVNVPPEARALKQIVRKSASNRVIDVDPVVRQYYVELDAPRLGDRRSDLERLQAALRDQWALDGLTIDTRQIPTLGRLLRDGQWRATVTVWQDREILRVRPGYAEGLTGLAVDLGTTTIAAYLCDLRTGETLATETAMNPQIMYGEDLMSRVSYGMLNRDGADKLNRLVIKAINDVTAAVAKAAQLRAEDIIDLVVVGNPIMHHLFLGIDPVELGGAPFALTVRESLDVKARDLGVKIHPAAYVHTLPCVAGHVGADCMAVALAEVPHQRPELTLIVDVGTNAEILLGNQHGLLSASSPTGPAFEGAQILHGQRAASGAIERVRIDPLTWEARFRVIGQSQWSDELPPEHLHATGICGSGIIEVVAELYLAGIVRGDGRFVDRHHPRLLTLADGRKRAYLLALADQTATGQPILVTQDDVRAIQLAKAALYAGVRLLMGHYGTARVERILLAGAFGSYIDPRHAMILGLIPDCDLDRVSAVGNAAGDGARIALVNRGQRQEAARLAGSIHYVETATDPGFQGAFISAIHIPHAEDTFLHLEGVLPQRPVSPRKRRTVIVKATEGGA